MSEVALPSTAELAIRAGVALIVVLGVALVSLRWLARRGLGRHGGLGGAALSLESRLALEPRRSLCIVRAGGRRWLLGVSEAGIAMLADLGGESAEPPGGTPDQAD